MNVSVKDVHGRGDRKSCRETDVWPGVLRRAKISAGRRMGGWGEDDKERGQKTRAFYVYPQEISKQMQKNVVSCGRRACNQYWPKPRVCLCAWGGRGWTGITAGGVAGRARAPRASLGASLQATRSHYGFGFVVFSNWDTSKLTFVSTVPAAIRGTG